MPGNPGNWHLARGARASKSHCSSKFTTSSKLTSRSVFSTTGSFGYHAAGQSAAIRVDSDSQVDVSSPGLAQEESSVAFRGFSVAFSWPLSA